MCSRFCASVPNLSSAGPSIQMPKLLSGGRQPRARISCASTLASSALKPAPPYSRGQVGTVQPRSAMRSSQRRCASDENSQWRPAQQMSSSLLIGRRISAGQLASSQARVSARKLVISVVSVIVKPR